MLHIILYYIILYFVSYYISLYYIPHSIVLCQFESGSLGAGDGPAQQEEEQAGQQQLQRARPIQSHLQVITTTNRQTRTTTSTKKVHKQHQLHQQQ